VLPWRSYRHATTVYIHRHLLLFTSHKEEAIREAINCFQVLFPHRPLLIALSPVMFKRADKRKKRGKKRHAKFEDLGFVRFSTPTAAFETMIL
jgi:hypothetical protein